MVYKILYVVLVLLVILLIFLVNDSLSVLLRGFFVIVQNSYEATIDRKNITIEKKNSKDTLVKKKTTKKKTTTKKVLDKDSIKKDE